MHIYLYEDTHLFCVRGLDDHSWKEEREYV